MGVSGARRSDSGTSTTVSARPQRLHTWMHLIGVDAYERDQPEQVLVLDTFATIAPTGNADSPYRVRFEGDREMTVVVAFDVIFVWYGDDLAHPDRPFPTLFAHPYPTRYASSTPTIFHETHVMDFVENGSDNLHFTAVHLWDQSRIYDHVVGPDTITLKQDTRFRYGKCSLKRHIRLLSKVLPQLELTQDYVYHGPCLAVVGAAGRGTPDMHALVSLTPEGPDRTRVHVTIALAPDTFPQWAERLFSLVSRKRRLCDVLAGIMAGYIKNEFDVDAIIWTNRRYTPEPALLPSERHLRDVIRWGETFYPPGFDAVPPDEPRTEPRWQELGRLALLHTNQVRRLEVGGRQLVAYLDDERVPRVFDAYCPHQGAHLGHGGRIEDGCLRCPFHALYFDGNGRCIGRNPDRRSSSIDTLELEVIPHRLVDDRVEVLV